MESSGLEWRELIDIGLTAALVYGVLATVRAARSALMLVLLGSLTAAYALARAYGMSLAAQALGVVLLSGCAYAVFISHDDVRRWLDRTAGLLSGRRDSGSEEIIDTLVAALERMGKSRIGALVVLPGTQSLGSDVHGGVELDAKLSVPMLLSLFDPSSPGHDGALIIRDGRASAFSVHLPLSTNDSLLGERGTRHAAALGLSERTDAMCIVVSEEQGVISVAQGRSLRSVSASELAQLLHERLGSAPARRKRASPPRMGLAMLRLALALGAAYVGWLARVEGSEEVTRTLQVPVTLESVPEGYEIVDTHPKTLEVTLSGPRSELMLLSDRDVELGIDGWAVKTGRRSFFVDPRQVRAAPGLEVRSVEPRRVRVEAIEPSAEAGPKGSPAP